MTLNDWLVTATKQLKDADITTARLDASVLAADKLRKNTAQLLAEPEQVLAPEQLAHLNQQLARRLTHEPLAYIRQKCEFYGRDFYVTGAVLTPRPETETMVELLKTLPQAGRQAVVDVGTGSGALAVTAACELGAVQVLGTDIDQACLDVARRNAQTHQATVQFYKTNLVADTPLPPHATILANLPYVPDHHPINQAAEHEPALAIFGGPDGLDYYRTLFEQLEQQGHAGYVLAEALPPQHQALSKIAASHGYKLQTSDDFVQVFYKS